MNMTFSQLMPLAPVLIVSLTSVLVMLLVAVKRHHALIATTTVLGLNAALLMIIWQVSQPTGGPAQVTSLFMVDGFALFYMAIVLVAALACTTLAHAYIDSYKNNREELYILLLIAVTGAMLLGASQNLSSFFIALELLSVPTYGLLAYTHERSQSLESGIKYMVLSATASAAMLMGMAFLYAYTGSLDFHQLGLGVIQSMHNPLVVVGLALVLFALAFKLSLVPFHGWTPDVYQGAPSPIATFLATVSKVAVLAVFLRFMLVSAGLALEGMQTVVTIIAVLSIVIGNLLAVRQVNIKRLLGYSSIAHFGYVLVALLSLGTGSLGTISIYVIAYVLTTLGAFGVVALMSSPYNGTEAESLADYRGLFWRRPVLTAVLTVMMLSLAGIPLTAGFIGKFFVILAAVQAQNWFLSGMVVLGSAIGLYYYLRVMVVLYMTPPDQPAFNPQSHWGTRAGGVMVLLVSLLVLLLGVYPEPMIRLAAMAQLVVN
jgi:NADH-quinone oxidoreductase subunit N